mmetsp:Transcript_24264/g.24551  ORF Transcript_24264/g.24551 Transcript_24264/m.24551 type:complete len:96 (+) Transcript_24264:379-666(+)
MVTRDNDDDDDHDECCCCCPHDERIVRNRMMMYVCMYVSNHNQKNKTQAIYIPYVCYFNTIRSLCLSQQQQQRCVYFIFKKENRYRIQISRFHNI